jgi:hypothetical protein
MGGSSVDGASGKSHGKKKSRQMAMGGSRAKKIKTHHVKTPSIVQDSDSDNDDNDKAPGSPDEGEFIVEDILDKRKEGGEWRYLIKWLGWKSDANTWEPVENMGGCEELLKKFEEEWSAKEKSANERASSEETVKISKAGSSSKKTQKPTKQKEKGDNKRERERSVTPAKKARVEDRTAFTGQPDSEKDNYEELDILDDCPKGRVPGKLIGVVPISDVLVYCVEWKVPKEETEDFNEPISLIRGEAFSKCFPELVIKFYEGHIIWSKDTKDEKRMLDGVGSGEKIGAKKSKDVTHSSDEESDDEPLASRKKSKKKAEDSDSDDSDSHSKENYP